MMKGFWILAAVAGLAVACSNSDGDDTGAGGGGGQDPYVQAASYAVSTIECTTDADCCVVFDGCLAEGYVVGIDDQETVRGLLDAGAAQEPACVGCIPPSIQVSCGADGFCFGEVIDCWQNETFMMQTSNDHCGTVTVPAECGGGGSGGLDSGGAPQPYIFGC